MSLIAPAITLTQNPTYTLTDTGFAYKHYFTIANNNDSDLMCVYNTGMQIITAGDSISVEINSDLPDYEITCSWLVEKDICPNMSWNEPTLRELLNDLCLVKDCLITLNNGVLEPMSLSKRGADYTSNQIIYVNKSQSLSDYSSELHCELDNAIDDVNSKNIYGMSFRNDEIAYFSSAVNGLTIKTNRPIYEINKLVVVINGLQRVDMTDYVKELGVLKTLQVGYGVSSQADTYQKNCVYYVRGENNIKGFDTEYKDKSFFIPALSVYENWINIIAKKINPNPDDTRTVSDYKTWSFEIEYTSIDKKTFRVSRGTNYNRIRNRRVTIDNQNNSELNIDRFINFEKNKLNRLSNKAFLIQQVHIPTFSTLANLFQTYDSDNVIFSKDIVINRRTYDVDYYACENYVFANYFTNIYSAKRNFAFIDNANAVKRNEFRKIYYELSFTDKTDTNIKYLAYSNSSLIEMLNGVDNVKNISLYALSPFIDYSGYKYYYNDDPRNVKFSTKVALSQLEYNEQLCVENSLSIFKNIVNYSFQLSDNIFAGYSVYWHNQDLPNDYPQAAFYNDGIKYGQTFNYLFVKFGGHNAIDESWTTNNSYDLPFNKKSGEQINEGLAQSYAFLMYKDNAEKLGLSFNFEWVSDSEDLEITKPAEHSLYNQKSKVIKLQKDNYFYDTDRNQLDMTNAYNVSYIGSNYKIGVFESNGKFYTENTKVNEICYFDINSLTDNYVSGAYILVYNLDDNKLYAENIKTDYINGKIIVLDKVELTAGIYITYYLTGNGYVHTQVSSFTNSGVVLINAVAPTIPNSFSIFNCTDQLGNTLTGTVNLSDNTLTITPNANSTDIKVNNSLIIHNVNKHLTGGNVKIYVKIKDYYV